ncbi:hypothetical protein BDV06DRAFT_146211 [Aspergillus oleicola]
MFLFFSFHGLMLLVYDTMIIHLLLLFLCRVVLEELCSFLRILILNRVMIKHHEELVSTFGKHGSWS